MALRRNYAEIKFVTQTGDGPGEDIVTPEEAIQLKALLEEANRDYSAGRFLRIL